MKNLITLIAVFVFSSAHIYAQSDCKVKMETINAHYEGDCKNGVADGKGFASGVDSYTGNFKKGLPDGKGKYVWANGDNYEGWWDKGQKAGKGVMTYKRFNKSDSVVTGFWKKDKYFGLYERPYVIVSRSAKVSSVSLNKDAGRTEKSVTFTLANSSSFSSNQALSNLILLSGSYFDMKKISEGQKSITYKLGNVVFPISFRLVLAGSQQVIVEINESGKWNMQVNLLTL